MGVTLPHLALLAQPAPLALYQPLPPMPPAQPAPPASHLVLQVMEVVINGLEMAPVMIQTTLKPAHLMVETVVDLT
jgi:hypothetical protein